MIEVPRKNFDPIQTGDSLGTIFDSKLDSRSKLSSQSPYRHQESQITTSKKNSKNLKMMSLKKMVGGAAHRRVSP
jgi:hypothetical protein